MSPARLLRAFAITRRPDRSETPAVAEGPTLSSAARQVLAYLLDHDAIATEQVGDVILAAHRHHLPAPRPAHRLPLARQLCLELVDDGLLVHGRDADTWTLPAARRGQS